MTRRATVAIMLGSAAAILAGGLGVTFAVLSRNASRLAIDTYLPAASTANQLLATVVDQETGERGYVITGYRRFLQPYQLGASQTPRLVASLARTLTGQRADLRMVADVSAKYATWLNAFALPQVHDVSSGNLSAAVEAERSGQGKSLFDAVRVSISDLTTTINRQATSATAHARALQDATLWVISIITLSAFAGVFLGRGLTKRWVTEPLQALDTQVAQVVAGDLENEVATAGPSEISSLGSNVEHMRVLVREQTTELTQQRNIAETLQRALLPQTLPTPPGFEITARYLPGVESTEVGGDWFNVRTAPGGRSFFAVGDVSGRGVAAAALMASMRYGINAYAAENPQPDDVLNRLGRLSHITDDGRFATVLCGLFDVREGAITLAKAGHLNPLLISDGLARVVELQGGPPIGLGNDDYVANRIPVRRGDTLLAYTDGLVERRDEPISAGVERLREAASMDAPLDSLMDRVLATLVPAGTDDDIVILGVRWKSS